tara:strand:+ start:414 stop:632 length:219 start_codon:yes stop_codon:yes gene_type:complete
MNNITKFPYNNKRSKCPICKNVSNKKNFPFCSIKCADLDLGKWFEGRYIISDPLNNIEENETFFIDEDKYDQ